MDRCICMWVHACGIQRSVLNVFLSYFALIVETRSLIESGYAGWSESWGIFLAPSIGTTGASHGSFGLKLGSSCLHGKNVTSSALSPVHLKGTFEEKLLNYKLPFGSHNSDRDKGELSPLKDC